MSISLAILLAAAPQEAPKPKLDPVCMEAFKDSSDRPYATLCETTELKDGFKSVRMEFNTPDMHGESQMTLYPSGKPRDGKSWAVGTRHDSDPKAVKPAPTELLRRAPR